jgi:hypothetical protein
MHEGKVSESGKPHANKVNAKRRWQKGVETPNFPERVGLPLAPLPNHTATAVRAFHITVDFFSSATAGSFQFNSDDIIDERNPRDTAHDTKPASRPCATATSPQNHIPTTPQYNRNHGA